MDTRDIETKKHFNQNVDFEPDRPLALGKRRVDLNLAARLTGAPDGSRIVLKSDPAKASFRVYHRFFSSAAEYEVIPCDTGYMLMSNVSISLHPQYQNSGLGLRMFAYEAYTAREVGIQQIGLRAARSALHNGYYSWPRYGFDVELEPEFIAALPAEYLSVRCVLDLMASEAGRAVWRERGYSEYMFFDLTDDRCWNVLAEYMKHKGVSL